MRSLSEISYPVFNFRNILKISHPVVQCSMHMRVCEGTPVTQLVEALRHKPEGRGFDSRLCHCIFFIDIILPAALWPLV